MSTRLAPAEVNTPRSNRFGALRRSELFWALLFLSPWLIGFLVFTAGPMLASLPLSFTSYDVINTPSFIGLDNYVSLFTDDLLRKSLWNTFFYAAFYAALH
ncbi:MAG: sugar ABC transporter permease, partial [Chloroflexi bacterium]|nr:sugar ABC transporter permease [Chloroflexota bacterium]